MRSEMLRLLKLFRYYQCTFGWIQKSVDAIIANYFAEYSAYKGSSRMLGGAPAASFELFFVPLACQPLSHLTMGIAILIH